MRLYILICLLTLFSSSLFGQGSNIWTAFYNNDSTLIGFKDKNEIVQIVPKFKGFTSARKFDKIIAVTEEINEKWKSSYLTKSGKFVGRDSLHIFDNGSDCESEGFIRFRDKKTDQVGMFNSSGNIVIPAEYNDLTRVRNGMVIALKGAVKKVWEGGENYSWEGGKEMLIDTINKVLIDNFKYDDNLNFYSLSISNKPSQDTIRKSFKAFDGNYYSFIDFEKEFRAWLKISLLTDLSKENLLKVAYDEITFWKEPNGWKHEAKRSFIDRNFELLKAKLFQLHSANCKYEIFDEGLNPYIYESDVYREFFNNCGESKDWIYPIKNIVIEYYIKDNLVQDHFEFLRTETGYKLICISIEKGEIK